MKKNSPSLVKIIISTDNHLGYLEKDPVRGDDSFRAFEEVLQLAKANDVDMVLLGGDLFHDNKPSRRTVVRTMQILRRMCLGYDEVRLAVRSDAAEINYMNENIAVSLPVFVIHGNHDDPTGAAGLDALSALDLLAEANLITYFGKIETAKKIDVAPILLQKGATKIALYGLGNVRDEVLYDTWSRQRKVRWLVPDADNDTGTGSVEPTERPESHSEEGEDNDDNEPEFVRKNADLRQSRSEWFNLFVLHQNRLTRGSSRGIAETLLPPWLNYVVWGHEHDSIPDLKLTKPPIVQPGSTVGTSLSAGEAKQKHAILLEVYKGAMKHIPIPLRTVRHFQFEDVVLSDQSGLDPLKPETVKKFLDDKVSKMIESQETLYDIERAALENRTAPIDGGGFLYAPNEWYLNQLTHITRQPLVRLRVETSGGWESLNTRRFGQPYVGRCACAADILLFHRHRRTKSTRPFLSGHVSGRVDEGDELHGEDYAEDIRNDIEGGAMDENVQKACQIPKLVQYYLYHRKAGGTGLQFLELDKLSTAVDEFVDKQEVQAIPNYVTKFLKDQQRRTLAEKGEGGDSWNEEKIIERFQNRAKEAANRHVLDGEHETETQKEHGDSMKLEEDSPEGVKEKAPRDLQTELEERLNSVDALVSQDPRLSKTLATANTKRLDSEDEGSDDDYEVKPAAKKIGRGRARATPSTARRKNTSSTPGRRTTTRQSKISSQKVVESDDGDDDDDDDDIMDEADWEAEQKRIALSSKPPRARPTRRSKTQSVAIEISDDEIEEVEDEECVAPKNTRKRKATISAQERNKRSKKDTTQASGRNSSFASRARSRRATPTINLDDD